MTVFVFLPKKGRGKKEILKIIPTPTGQTDYTKQRPKVSPFKEPYKNNLSKIKRMLIGGYKFNDIVLEYREKGDVVIVFYKNSSSTAQEQALKFFQSQGIESLAGIEIEYIGLIKKEDEPPAGFFLD